MDSIFLTPDITFDVSIKTTFSDDGHNIPRFSISDGGPYKLRTATGRQYAKIQQAYIQQDADAAYALLPEFLVAGVEKTMIPNLHPAVVWEIFVEVLKRSRVSEVDRGK